MAATKKKELDSDETRRQFERHIRKLENGCWIWQGSKDGDGYGQFRWNGRLHRSHRFSCMLYKGETEDSLAGMDVDHTCPTDPEPPNRACVNPDHLAVKLHVDNIRAIRREGGEQEPTKGAPVYRSDPTESGIILAWCLGTMEKQGWKAPDKFGVQSMDGAPWREYGDFTDETLTDVRLRLLALFLYAISMGVSKALAAREILGVHGDVVKRWNANPEWKTDMETARRGGKAARTTNLKETVEDTLIARLPYADMKDVVRAYDVMTRNEEARADRRSRKEQGGKALGGGPTINFFFPPGTTEQDIARLTEQVVEASVRDVTNEPQPVAALPSGNQLDEDFEEAFGDDEDD